MNQPRSMQVRHGAADVEQIRGYIPLALWQVDGFKQFDNEIGMTSNLALFVETRQRRQRSRGEKPRLLRETRTCRLIFANKNLKPKIGSST